VRAACDTLQEDISKCEDRYNRSKVVHGIMRHVAETTSAKLEDLYTQFGWPLYKKYGHAFEAFKLLVAEPELMWNQMKVRAVNGPSCWGLFALGGGRVSAREPVVPAWFVGGVDGDLSRRVPPQSSEVFMDAGT
jgi:hypothetical protein